MRELTATEVTMVSGGSFSVEAEQAVVGGAAAGALTQAAKGARIGSVLGPKGAVGGAIIGGLAYGITSAYSQFRNS
ncbi:MAG: hypothetical protein WEB57_09230 [Pseudohongiellaceae bacterium]